MKTKSRAPITSSWISDVLSKTTPDGKRYLAIFTHDGHGTVDKALFYSGDKEALPSYLPGLICAGCGGRSVGKAYHKLLKAKRADGGSFEGLQYQEIKGKDKVQELREMMK